MQYNTIKAFIMRTVVDYQVESEARAVAGRDQVVIRCGWLER